MQRSWGNSSQYSVWLQIAWLGFNPQQRQRIFPQASVSRPALRHTQPPVQWVGNSSPAVLSQGKVWPGHDADHSPPSSAKVKNDKSYM
jgi:hypothetical protein